MSLDDLRREFAPQKTAPTAPAAAGAAPTRSVKAPARRRPSVRRTVRPHPDPDTASAAEVAVYLTDAQNTGAKEILRRAIVSAWTRWTTKAHPDLIAQFASGRISVAFTPVEIRRSLTAAEHLQAQPRRPRGTSRGRDPNTMRKIYRASCEANLLDLYKLYAEM